MKAAKDGSTEIIKVFLQRRCKINLQENVLHTIKQLIKLTLMM